MHNLPFYIKSCITAAEILWDYTHFPLGGEANLCYLYNGGIQLEKRGAFPAAFPAGLPRKKQSCPEINRQRAANLPAGRMQGHVKCEMRNGNENHYCR